MLFVKSSDLNLYSVSYRYHNVILEISYPIWRQCTIQVTKCINENKLLRSLLLVILIPKWYLGQLSTWHSFTTWNMCHKYVQENKLPCICSFFHKGIIMVSMKRSYLIHMLIAWHIYHSIFQGNKYSILNHRIWISI
jgi:hypothetical protein